MFFTVIICLLIILLMARFFIVPLLNLTANSITLSITNSIVDNLFASLITTVVVGWFVFWITPQENRKKIELIESTQLIERKFKIARESTDYWNFNGGTGRYTRTITIPKLTKIASTNKSVINISMILMNPNNRKLCKIYANYKNSLEVNDNKKWTTELVRCQIFASILMAFSCDNAFNFLELRVFVKDNFSLLRMDISQNYIIITKEDPTLPVLLFEKEFYLFSPYREDFNQTIKQSTEIISSDKTFEFLPNEVIDIEKVQEFFNSLSVESPKIDEIAEIIKIIQKDENPFPVGFSI